MTIRIRPRRLPDPASIAGATRGLWSSQTALTLQSSLDLRAPEASKAGTGQAHCNPAC